MLLHVLLLRRPQGRMEGQNGPVNRTDIAKLIESGHAQGFLAYQDSKPVGWCNAAPRKMLPTLTKIPINASRRSRQSGFHSMLRCCEEPQRTRNRQADASGGLRQSFRKQGLSFAEAYPASEAKSEADNYPGPLSMYLANGFTIYRQNESVTIVRKALHPSVS